MDNRTSHFKKGMIILWYGPIVLIPTGWQLCDGTNGSPDLDERFVMGAGAVKAPGGTGGSNTHGHTFIANAHNHAIGSGSLIGGGANYDSNTDARNVTGTTDTGSSKPPYHSLCYIMKL